MSALTRRTCMIYTFIHQIYANHNLVAQAVLFVQNGNLGRACEAIEKVSALVYSPPLEGWQAKPDGVVVVVLH